MRISKHITYAEAIHSNTAKRRRIDNTPNPTQVDTMKLTAEKIFEPLREWVGGPIKVNSFFRSIREFGTDMNPNWIHVSYVSKEENRGRCLKAYKEDGRTKYKVI